MIGVLCRLDMDKKLSGHVLLVGEGDFSLSLAILEHGFINSSQMVTSSIESRETISKHHAALNNIKQLEDRGVTVQFEIDARYLHSEHYFTNKTFSRIIFNFPHSGGKSNHKKNRMLLNDFFLSASQVLEEKGQIMVTLCKGQGGTPADKPMRAWHDSWQVVSMAANASLILTNVIPFNAEEFTLYNSVGYRSQDKGFNTDNAITHVFEYSESVPILSTFETTFTHQDQCYHTSLYLHDKLKRNILKDSDHPVTKIKERLIDSIQQHINLPLKEVVLPAFIECTDTESESLSEVYTFRPRQMAADCKEDVGGQEMENIVCPTTSEKEKFHQPKTSSCIRLRSRFTDQLSDLQHHVDSSSCSVVSTGLVGAPCLIDPHHVPVHHQLILSCSTKTTSTQDLSSFSTTMCNCLHEFFSNDILLEVQFEESEMVDQGQSMTINYTKDGCMKSIASTIATEGFFFALFDLDSLACLVYGIEDPRLLWSTDNRFLQQFKNPDKSAHVSYKPFNIYPMRFEHDMSFWEKQGEEFNEMQMYDIVREVTGDVVNRVTLLDTYTDSNTQQRGRCYRFIYCSCDKTLSYTTSWKLQSTLRLEISRRMGIKLR